MIFMRTGSTDIFYNLAAEFFLAAHKQLEDTVFMLWQTSPPTLVCGRYQNVFQEIDMSYVKEKNYVVARRLSGGGTVYQDEHVFQYAFIEPQESAGIDFSTYLTPVAMAMGRLGVPVTVGGRNDLMIGDHKVSGTAQYHTAGYIVHHGTVLYDADLEELERCLTVDAEKIRSKGIRSVRERVVNMKQFTGDQPVADFLDALSREILGGDVYACTFSPEDERCIRALAAEKFGSWNFIYGSSPECTMIRSGRVAAGQVAFHLTLEKGRIARCHIQGDFFARKDLAGLTEALTSCRYEKNDLQICLERADAAGYFYGVDNGTLLDILI